LKNAARRNGGRGNCILRTAGVHADKAAHDRFGSMIRSLCDEKNKPLKREVCDPFSKV